MALSVPRTGPCSPWVTATDLITEVGRSPDYDENETPLDQDLAADVAEVVNEVLYALSGRQFTGACGPVTVRPMARPVDADTRHGSRGLPSGFVTAGQMGAAWGLPASGVASSYGTSRAPTVELGTYPVTEVELVKIDGIVIPSNEYYLYAHRQLVRLRPSGGATPTARWGWPVSQVMDLPDTEPGTFSVTYSYGAPPPAAGRRAAMVLGRQLLLNEVSQEDTIPQRITSISRQGVSMAIVDVMDFFQRGQTGIYEVDLFLATFNPNKAKHRPMVWSPDIGRPVRMPQ